MAQTWDPSILTSGEEHNDPSIIGSVAAGIATGLIRIPQGAASLFASIYDLTNDTNTAQGVEEWFDENIYSKLGDIDEKAEATTAGKITAALVNIGIPGGLPFVKERSSLTMQSRMPRQENILPLTIKR